MLPVREARICYDGFCGSERYAAATGNPPNSVVRYTAVLFGDPIEQVRELATLCSFMMFKSMAMGMDE